MDRSGNEDDKMNMKAEVDDQQRQLSSSSSSSSVQDVDDLDQLYQQLLSTTTATATTTTTATIAADTVSPAPITNTTSSIDDRPVPSIFITSPLPELPSQPLSPIRFSSTPEEKLEEEERKTILIKQRQVWELRQKQKDLEEAERSKQRMLQSQVEIDELIKQMQPITQHPLATPPPHSQQQHEQERQEPPQKAGENEIDESFLLYASTHSGDDASDVLTEEKKAYYELEEIERQRIAEIEAKQSREQARMIELAKKQKQAEDEGRAQRRLLRQQQQPTERKEWSNHRGSSSSPFALLSSWQRMLSFIPPSRLSSAQQQKKLSDMQMSIMMAIKGIHEKKEKEEHKEMEELKALKKRLNTNNTDGIEIDDDTDIDSLAAALAELDQEEGAEEQEDEEQGEDTNNQNRPHSAIDEPD